MTLSGREWVTTSNKLWSILCHIGLAHVPIYVYVYATDMRDKCCVYYGWENVHQLRAARPSVLGNGVTEALRTLAPAGHPVGLAPRVQLRVLTMCSLLLLLLLLLLAAAVAVASLLRQYVFTRATQ